MKILIYGLTDISYLIVKDLCKDHDIIMIDDREDLPARFEKLDMSFISGSISDPAILAAAQVKECNLFISCSKYDESNIVAVWAVTRTTNIETVCFVSKLEYYKNIYNDEFYISEVGIDHVLWPDESLVQEIFRIVSVPEVIYVDYFEGGRARLFEYKIKEGFSMIDKELRTCRFPENTIMLALTRDDQLFIPNGMTKLKTGDRPIFIGTPKGLSILARDMFFTKEERIDTAAIVGGGNVGYMLAQRLESVGIKTKIIEQDIERCEFLSEKLKSTLIINSNAADIEIFEEEEIGESDVVINVTNNDETNLFCSVMAKQMGAKKVFARASSLSMTAFFEKAGVDVVLSPGDTILTELKNKIINKDTNLIAFVGKGQGEIFELNVPASFDNKAVRELKLPCKAIICVQKQGRKITIPKGDTILRKKDRIIVFTKASDSQNLKEFFQKANEA